MALTEDKIVRSRGAATMDRLPIADGAKIHVGSLVAVSTAGGGALPAEDDATHRVVGVALSLEADGDFPTGEGDAAGTQYVVVGYDAEFELDIDAAARDASSIGANMEVVDDGTVGKGTNAVMVGELRSFTRSDMSKGWVAVRQFAAYDLP